MDLVNILHMNAGHHKYSYANSSTLQKNAILKSTKVLEDTIENYGSHGFSERFKVADLGCSCGPNPFLLITTIINSIDAVCQKNNIEAPDEFQVFLNDLPSNDFNTLFKMIPEFYSKLENHEKNTHGRSAKCFIFGAPGSFYTRLFPSKSLHFVHSSYAVHWLSRVPKMLLNNNKRHIYIAKGSPPCVYEAYLNQYKRDFATFLRMRSQEIICDGRMVLSFLGRSIADPTSKDCSFIYELLAKSLGDMLAERKGILKSTKVLEDTIESYGIQGFSECFTVADLGCSSGPNTFLLMSNIINSVHAVCQKNHAKAPDEFQVFLNDLPSNDFNTLFKLTPEFYSKLKYHEKNTHGKSAKCNISGVLGSFYTRLFPSKSLHFVHSSYAAVLWLSQVPQMLLNNNKRYIYMAKGSPPCVYEAYLNQYKRDFTTFLQMRSQEIISHGRMVLTFLGRSIADPASKDCCYFHELLAKSLEDMLAEGLLYEEDLNSFNMPIYTPCIDEVKAIIESERSFSLDRVETFEVNWDTRDAHEIIKSKDSSGEFVAKTIRAVTEPLLASHFGINNVVMDKIFQSYAKRVNEHLSMEKASYFNIVVSLTRK